MPTVDDVAQAASVSRQTVSNVLNSPDIVRESTRERVQQAIQRTRLSPARLRSSPAHPPLLNHRDSPRPAARRHLRRRARPLRAQARRAGRCPRPARHDLHRRAARTTSSPMSNDCATAPTWMLSCSSVPSTATSASSGSSSTACPSSPSAAPGAVSGTTRVTAGSTSMGARACAMRWRNCVHPVHRASVGSAGPAPREPATSVAPGGRKPAGCLDEDRALLSQSTEDGVDAGRQCAMRLLTQPSPPDAIICASDSLALGALMAATNRRPARTADRRFRQHARRAGGRALQRRPAPGRRRGGSTHAALRPDRATKCCRIRTATRSRRIGSSCLDSSNAGLATCRSAEPPAPRAPAITHRKESL